MSTEYTIFVGQHEIETVTISTTRSAEDMSDINEFRQSLTQEERQLFSFVSEYELEDTDNDLEDCDVFMGSDYQDECSLNTTPEELALIKKVEDFLGIE